MAAPVLAAAAGSSAGSAGAGAAGGPIALAIVLALVITKEIFKARRTERREMLKKKYPPIQVASAAQRLKNILGENGEALAVVETLTAAQQMTITPPQYQYSYMETPVTQELPVSRQQRLMELMGWTEPQQDQRRSKTGPVNAPGKTNPSWAEELAEVLLNLTNGNINKLNPYSLPKNEYNSMMQKVASGEIDAVYRTYQEPDCFTKDDNYKWLDEYGVKIYQLALEKGFSEYGAITIIAHAYREQATTVGGRASGRRSNNWWNFGPLKSKGQTSKGRFAEFSTIEAGFDAYYDRITSPSDLIEYKNPNFNPSYPLFGELLKKNRFASEEELLQGFRIKVGDRWGHTGGHADYVYVWDEEKELPYYTYAQELRSLIETVKRQFDTYLTMKIKCLQTEIDSLTKLREGLLKGMQQYGPLTYQVTDPYSPKIKIFQDQIKYFQGLKTTINSLTDGL